MALRLFQEKQFHTALALYLEQAFPKTYTRFVEEAREKGLQISGGLKPSERAGQEPIDSETLTKRWAATARLQTRLSALQQQLIKQKEQLDLFVSATAEGGAEASLPSMKASWRISAGRQPIGVVLFHPLLPQLLVGADDGSIRVFAVSKNGEEATLLRLLKVHEGPVNGLAFNLTGSRLASCSSDLTVKVFEVHGNYDNCVSLQGHEDIVSDICFCLLTIQSEKSRALGLSNGASSLGDDEQESENDPYSLLTCSRDGTVKLWDIGLKLCIKTFIPSLSIKSLGSITGLNMTYAGIRDVPCWIRTIDSPGEELSVAKVFFSAGNSTKVLVWRFDMATPIKELNGHTHVVEAVLCVSPAMLRHLALHNMAPAPLPASILNGRQILEVEQQLGKRHILRDYGLVIFSASRDNSIKMWDAYIGDCKMTLVRHTFSPRIFITCGHNNWVRDLAAHPSGKHLLSCSDDRTIRCWNIVKGTCDRVINRAHGSFVTSISFDFHRNLLASASLDSSIKLWSCRPEADIAAEEELKMKTSGT